MFWTSGSMDVQHATNFNSREEMSYGGSETQLGTRSHTYWTPKARWLTFALSIFIVISIGLAIAVAVIGVKLSKTRTSSGHPCLSADCVRVSGDILSKLDRDVDPCVDFYSFACGGWVKENPSPPPTQASWGQFEILRNKLAFQLKEILEGEFEEERVPNSVLLAQEFYDTCVSPSEDGAGDVVDLLRLIERVIGKNDSISPANLTPILFALKRELDGNYIFGLDVDLDEGNTTQHAVYLDQPRFGIPVSFLNDRLENQMRKNYLTLITTVWKFVFPTDAARAAAIAVDILDVETALASIATSPDERRNRSSTYNKVTLTELRNITRDEWALDWGLYFQGLFQYEGIFNNRTGNEEFPQEDWDDIQKRSPPSANQNVSFNIVLRDLNYFRKLGSVLDVNYNGRDILNYLKWRIIWDYGSEASEELRRIFFDYAKATHGYQLAPEKWRLCVEETNMFFGMALSTQYVLKHFPHQYATQVSALVSDVRDAFDLILSRLDWLDPLTRELARKKGRSMKSFVGFPTWLNDVKVLDEYYWGLPSLNSPESHLLNFVQLARWRVNRDLSKAFRVNDPTEWIAEPTVVNAFYSYEHNSINFPAGILQPPFFRMPMQALNYGAIGSIIGHEITHGFDETGRQTDWEGKTADWWEPASLSSYMERSKCFAEEYSNFTTKIGGSTWHVDGNLTLSENIADNGGLGSAFEAYGIYRRREGEEGILPGLEEFNPSQLFTIAYAQVWCGSYTAKGLQEQFMFGPHAPNEFRVKGSLRNFREFNVIWKCNKTGLREAGEGLDKTCHIW